MRNDTTGNPASTQIIYMSAFARGEDAGSNYRDYLMKYQEMVGPSMWETSVYPAIILSNDSKYNDYNLFFTDLEIFSLMSRYCERPFWYTVRCQGYTTPSNLGTPDPNVEEMRFSAFSALAYGAQGLLYWSYRQRENEPNVTYTAAPVDLNGNRNTEIWDAVCAVNEEVIALNEVFFESFLVQVRHTGTKQYGCTRMLKTDHAFGPLMSIQTGNDGVLLSHINTHGVDYLVIVNHVFMKGEAVFQRIHLAFDNSCILYKIEANYPLIKETKLTARNFEIDLPRGGYLIYRWS